MASKDKENKSLQDKLKQLFKSKGYAGHRSKSAFELTDDIVKDLGNKDAPNSTRLKRLKDISERVVSNKLESEAVARLWGSIDDIFTKDQSTELRNAAFAFLLVLIKSQRDELKIMGAQFFRFVKKHQHPDDVANRLQVLITLTNNGKNIQHFEEEVGPFLLDWFPDITRAKKLEEYLEMLINVVKFNAVYLDGYVLTGLVEHICILCCSITDYNIVILCLRILETIVAYSNLPPDSLPKFIGALCRTVNNEPYSELSWKVIRDLLGTHKGHSALYTMCKILQEPGLRSETNLLRGAIFYIHMALWNSLGYDKPLTNLCCPPGSVLPSILQAVKTDEPTIAYEAILGIQGLVSKQGAGLQNPAWTVILEIVTHVNRCIEANPNQTPSKFILGPLHETLNSIEKLLEEGKFNGPSREFFDIIEECAHTRPESSVLRLIMYLSESIVPTQHLWLSNLYNLLNRYFKPDVRTNIRLKVLGILSKVVQLNRMIYEEELIERIIIPHTLNIANDTDIVVRASVAKLLIDLCISCESKRCLEMLDILEKMLLRPFENHLPDKVPPNESEFCDIKSVVIGLIKVFTHKIHRLPSSHAISIYKMLVRFIEMHYIKPKIFESSNQVRLMIFDCFLKMRANALYHLGCSGKDNKVQFSSYLCVTNKPKERGPLGSPPPPQSSTATQQPQCVVTYVSIKRALKVFISCLEMERDWEVLHLVLQEMPKVLQNKPLILSRNGNNELDVLVDILCAMISDKSLNLPESLNVKISRADFHSAILLVLVSLPPYHACLDQVHQQKMVRCLTKCITNSLRSSPKQCIEALMICTLEMRDAMVKMLPELLLTLSKISATIYIAIPVLEFLSTLTQLPMVFASFVDEQYMAVFAISFPYTNPFKYNHYTVSLAHYVIAVWFLKCRLPFRKNSVKFITSGLQTNVLTPFEETNLVNKVELSKLNIDSSDRKRSSSLTEQGPRRRSQTVSAYMEKPHMSLNKKVDRSVLTFYEELTETCIDLMARYTFSPCSALPRRLPTAEFLLNGGQSMCWLVDNKLITVTTSGCSQKVLKNGLCDKCWNFCNGLNENRSQRFDRSGSNDNQDSNKGTRQNSNDKSNTNTSASSPIDENKKLGDKLEQLPSKLQKLITASTDRYEKQLCACWCQGWAEVYVRRPTGDTSWIMRIQNQISSQSACEFPLNDLSTLFMSSFNCDIVDLNSGTKRANSSEEPVIVETFPQNKESSTLPISIPSSPSKQSPSRQSSRDSVDDDLETIYDDGTKSRNPVRRSNSSPEMSNWKNPFMHPKQEDDKSQDDDTMKKCKVYCKDMRVSYEAIPEEMAGTTPPSDVILSKNNAVQTISSLHPSLLSCHSYPGSSPPKGSNIPSKPNQTVPPSPNVIIGNINPMFSQKIAGGLMKGVKSESLDSVKSDKILDRPNNLPSLTNLVPLSSKPPQSPTQTSPRLSRHVSKEKEANEIQKSASASILERNMPLNFSGRYKERRSSGSAERLSEFDPSQLQKRDRVHTISVSNISSRKPRLDQIRQLSARPKDTPKSGINPSFIFLQFYHRASFGDTKEKPMLIGTSDVVRRAVKVLDSIPPYETHKIGILYIREGQCNKEVDILKNRFGSLRYVEFLQKLGTLIKLQDVDPQIYFLGGLDQNGEDGKFSYIWQDDVVKIIFHVATMMPNKESDPNCNVKKSHIGNNNVTIVYNESGDEYNINTIKSQFNFASIIIHPLDHNLNRVVIKCKSDLNDLIGSSEPKIVSDQNVAILVRQLALHANLASLVHRSLSSNSQNPYASNWLERLRQIKRIRTKIIQEIKNQPKNDQGSSYPSEDNSIYSPSSRRKQMEDFTEYT